MYVNKIKPHTQYAFFHSLAQVPGNCNALVKSNTTPATQGFHSVFLTSHPVTATGPSWSLKHTVMYKSYGWATGPMPSLILSTV